MQLPKLFLSFILIFSVISCGSGDDESTQGNADDLSEESLFILNQLTSTIFEEGALSNQGSTLAEAAIGNFSLTKEDSIKTLVDGSLSTECSIYADGYEVMAYSYVEGEIDNISIYELPAELAEPQIFILGCVDTCMNEEGTYTYQSNLGVTGVNLETGASYANCEVTACSQSWIVNGHGSSYFEDNTVRISGTYELTDHNGALHGVDFDYILSQGLSDCSNYIGQITFDGIFYDASQVCQSGLSSIESGDGCGSP